MEHCLIKLVEASGPSILSSSTITLSKIQEFLELIWLFAVGAFDVNHSLPLIRNIVFGLFYLTFLVLPVKLGATLMIYVSTCKLSAYTRKASQAH